MAVQQLRAVAEHIPTNSNERKTLYIAARELMLQTESKWDTQHRILYGHISNTVAQIAMDLRIFRLLATEPGREWSAAQLAETTGAEHDLIIRIMRALAAYGMLDQLSPTTFQATNITQTLALDSSEKTSTLHWKCETPWIDALLQFLAREGYKNPVDSANTAFHMAMKTTMSQFEWMDAHPGMGKAMFEFMPMQRADQVDWIDQPQRVSQKDVEMSSRDVEGGRAMFVDVGGGAGHQGIALREKRPDLKGRVVLQDISSHEHPSCHRSQAKAPRYRDPNARFPHATTRQYEKCENLLSPDGTARLAERDLRQNPHAAERCYGRGLGDYCR